MINQATEVLKESRIDGDINAVVVRISDTGDEMFPINDRYKHTIKHGLGRTPIGCQVIMSDKICNVKTINKDFNNITVQFDSEHADVNLRIW